MLNFGNKTGAVILGGLLSMPALQGAAAACEPGDLAGFWNKYASKYVVDSAGPPQVIACSLNLTKTSNSPIKYSISGSCKSFITTGVSPTNLTVSGNSSLTETAACKLTGSFVLGGKTVTILDAKVEGGTPKRQITGISRITNSGSDFELFDFNFQR